MHETVRFIREAAMASEALADNTLNLSRLKGRYDHLLESAYSPGDISRDW